MDKKIGHEKKIFSNSGVEFEILYKFKTLSNGKKELMPFDKKNIYKEIQMYKDDTDIYSIIAKVGGVENLSLLDNNKGFYADITEFPKNIFDYENSIDNLKIDFDKLPIEQKEIFNFDFDQFAHCVLSGELPKVIKNLKDNKNNNNENNDKKEVDIDSKKGEKQNAA